MLVLGVTSKDWGFPGGASVCRVQASSLHCSDLRVGFLSVQYLVAGVRTQEVFICRNGVFPKIRGTFFGVPIAGQKFATRT